MLLVILATFAQYAEIPGSVVVRADADLASLPAAAELIKFYPERAFTEGTEGYVVMVCTRQEDVALSACRIEVEAPLREHFGAAALKLAPLLRMRPTSSSGDASARRDTVRVSVRFIKHGRWDTARNDIIATARACYGQVAHRAEQDLTLANGWRAAAYWSHQLAAGMAAAYNPPSDYERAMAQAQADAASGALKPPPGADLKSCLSKVPKN